MLRAYYLCSLRVFDLAYTLEKLKSENIKIKKVKKTSEYTYTFLVSIKDFKRLKLLFANVEIIKKVGYAFIFFSMLQYKTTLVAMVLSILFYLSLSSKIWKINIIGDSENLNNFIKNELIANNIYVGAKKLNTNDLSALQNKILYSNYDVIEYLSLEEDGCAINAFFRKKRQESEHLHFKGNLYAKKDGLIKSFDLLSGEKVVKINDYVKKGALLVKDILTTDYQEEIYIGTYGSVYAYTWYYVTIDQKISGYEQNVETLLANLLINIKSKISRNFTEYEAIYEENMLQFKYENERVFLKMHFTCIEDIAGD